MLTEEVWREVTNRVEVVVAQNTHQQNYKQERIINVRAAIELAFMLGTRFGVAHPYLAGDYMGRWFNERHLTSSTEEIAARHTEVLEQCLLPIHQEGNDE